VFVVSVIVESGTIGDGGFNPSRCTVEFDLVKVVHTHWPLSPNSIFWSRRKLQGHRETHTPRVHGLAASAGVCRPNNWGIKDFTFASTLLSSTIVSGMCPLHHQTSQVSRCDVIRPAVTFPHYGLVV